MLARDPHAATKLKNARAQLVEMQRSSERIIRLLTDLAIPAATLGVCFAASTACAEIGYKLHRAIDCVDAIVTETERKPSC
jgi:hypothetical protein